jgi:hypothetical protein
MQRFASTGLSSGEPLDKKMRDKKIEDVIPSYFFVPHFLSIVFAPKKMRLQLIQITASFDHNREMMKQVYLTMKTFAAPGAIPSQQRLRGGLY